MSSTLEHDPRVIAETAGVRGMIAEYRRRLRQGDIGQLPVLVGVVVIWTTFEIASHGVFFDPFNLVNLTLQMAATGTISVGLVLVLLLGEIDLSAGVVSGLCGGIMAVLNVRFGVPAPAAVGLALAAGAAVGTFHGMWFTRFGIPSFVVTLAGLLAWQGALLMVLGSTGSINLVSPFIVGLAGTFFTGPAAYVLVALFVAYVAIAPLVTQRRRAAAGLTAPPLIFVAVRAGAITAVAIAAVVLLDADRGISSGLLFLIGAVIAMDFILRRTRFGRMIYAIGGNAEAARRAGVSLAGIRTWSFALCSATAALGGILLGSFFFGEYSTNTADPGQLVLYAVAAAVIGGVSLFGGRGKAVHGILGGLLIGGIAYGVSLLSLGQLSTPLQYILPGAVLIGAVLVDVLSRRGSGSVTRV
jgi:D-xylose transport system permease protein